MAVIYVVEDDKNIREIESIALKNSGHQVEMFEYAGDFLEAVKTQIPDLLLLDIMLPDADGLELVEKLRKESVTRQLPIILVTAKTTELDKVKGLDIGADDYLVKPFAFEELLARIRVLIRKNSVSNSNVITVADLTVDISSRKVTRGDKDISLSAKEYELLQYLAVNNGIVLSREKIEDHIWNYDYEGGTNVVDVYIRYLRKKIDEDHDKKLIHTVRGMGYVLREEK